MDLGYAALGALGFVALVATLVLAMRVAERLVARLLVLPTFRWFEVRTAPGWGWKRLLVRSASAAVPFALCAALFFIVMAVGGAPQPTTAVEVLDGAARDAGMRDGDKLLSVGSVPVDTWDEARAQIKTHAGPVKITVERSGQRQELSVTADNGRIGIAPVYAMRTIAIGQAALSAMRLPLTVVTEIAKSFIRLHHVSDTELKGPAGIVRETRSAARTGWLSFLHFLGLLGCCIWPFVAAVHLFDVVTGWTFRMTVTEASLPEQTLRIARLSFSMYFALGCWLAFMLVETASAKLPGALPLIALLMPGVWALWPLLWISSRELWSQKWPWGVLVPVAFVPCMAPVMGVWVALCLRKEERRLRSHSA